MKKLLALVVSFLLCPAWTHDCGDTDIPVASHIFHCEDVSVLQQYLNTGTHPDTYRIKGMSRLAKEVHPPFIVAVLSFPSLMAPPSCMPTRVLFLPIGHEWKPG
jgi:hypothetical protein